jgi:hypothetical protein
MAKVELSDDNVPMPQANVPHGRSAPRFGPIRRFWWVGLIIGVIAIAIAAGQNSDNTAATPASTPVTARVAASVPVASIPVRPTSGAATLGAPESAFIATLGPTGPDTVQGAADHFARCSGGADQYMVTFTAGHATTILRQYCGTPPSAVQRRSEAQTFFPGDASATGMPYTDEDGDPASTFSSARLAGIFQPADFQACVDTTPAGTFELDVTRTGWQIGLGRCP